MAKIRPWEIHPEPVGSLDEINEIGFDPAFIGSCSQPSENNAGCYAWGICELSCKGTRPHNFGVEIIKPAHNGGGVVQIQKKCTHYTMQKDQLRKNDVVMNIIAREGETIRMRGTEPDEASRVRMERDPQTTNARFKPFERDVEITKFPPLRENPEFTALEYAARQQRARRSADDLIARARITGEDASEFADVRDLIGRPSQGNGADEAGGEGEPSHAPRRGRPPRTAVSNPQD